MFIREYQSKSRMVEAKVYKPTMYPYIQMYTWKIVDFISIHFTAKHTKTFNPLCKTKKFDDVTYKIKHQIAQQKHYQNCYKLYMVNITQANYITHKIKSNILCLFM